jgi:predicted nucleic acid-binding Zn ribbon protein
MGHHYEQSEGFEAPTEQTCPTCGSRSRRQISLPAVIFKGPGFYSTDNRKGFASGNGGRSSFSSDGGSEKREGEPKAESDSGSKAEAAAD